MPFVELFRRNKQLDEITSVVTDIFRIFHIPSTKSQIRNKLITHPDYPSLLSISEVLLECGLKTKALKGTIKDLSDADFPSIAYLNSNKFVVIEEIDGDYVKIIFPDKGKLRLTIDSFEKNWSGILLRIFTDKEIHEKDYCLHHKNEFLLKLQKIIAYFGLPFFIAVLFFYGMFHSSIDLKILMSNFAWHLFSGKCQANKNTKIDNQEGKCFNFL